MPTGILNIDFNTNISSLGAQRMARQGPGNIFSNATSFLVNQRGLGDGDFIWVTPGAGTTAAILFVQDAGLQTQNALTATGTGSKTAKKTSKKVGTKAGTKAGKQAAKKTGSKNTSSKNAKKSSKKKSGKSSPRKATAKKSGKKSSKKSTK